MSVRDFKVLIIQIKQQLEYAQSLVLKDPVQCRKLQAAVYSTAVALYQSLVEPNKQGLKHWPNLQAWLASCELQQTPFDSIT